MEKQEKEKKENQNEIVQEVKPRERRTATESVITELAKQNTKNESP